MQLDNGSATIVQEGRSAATGVPNEQVMTTEAGGQIDDAIVGEGATANLSGATVTLEQGAAATITGNQNTVADSDDGPLQEGRSVAITGNNNTDQGGAGDDVTLNGIGNSATNVTAGTIAVADGSTGTTLSNDTSDTINAGQAVSANIIGANDTVNLTNNSGESIGLSGTNQVVTGESGTNLVNLFGDGTSATISGGGYVGIVSSDDSLTLGSTGMVVATAPDISNITITGTDASISLVPGVSGTVIGANDTVGLDSNSGAYVAIEGTNQTVTGDAGNDIVNVYGANTDATVYGGGYVGIISSGDSLTLGDQGMVVATAPDISNITVTGSDASISLVPGVSGTVIGANDTVGLDSNSGAYVAVEGTNQTVTGDSGNDIVNLAGDGTNAAVYGGGYVGMVASNEALYLEDEGSTVGTTNSISGLMITGADASINLGVGVGASLNGSNDTINLGGYDSGLIASGTGDVVNNDVAGDAVNLGSNTSVTLTGSGGYFGIEGTGVEVTASNDSAQTWNNASFTLNGNGDTISTGTGSVVTLNGGSDTLNLGAGANATLNGSNDTLSLGGGNNGYVQSGTGDIVDNDVGGDVVNLGSNTSTTINGSGGYFGIVGTGVDVSASGESSNTFAGASYTLTGNSDSLQLGANASAELIGSNDTLTLNGGGASGSAYGSAFSYIASGTGDAVYNDVAGDGVNLGSNTSTTINGSGGYFGIVGTGVDVSASGESSNTFAGASYTLTGNSDSLQLGANASAELIGSNDTLTLNGGGASGSAYGSAFSYIASGTGDAVYNDVAGDGVNLGSNTSTTINGSGGYFGIVGTGVDVSASGESSNTFAGASYTLTGNNDSLQLGANASAELIGSNDTLNLNGGGASGSAYGSAFSYIASGTGDAVYNDVAGDGINLGSNTSTTINGSGGYFGVVGTGVNVVASGESSNTFAGASYTLTGNNDSLTLAASSSVTVNGVDSVDFTGSNSSVTLNTVGDIVNQDGSFSGNSINIEGGHDANDAYDATINVSNTLINVGAGEYVNIVGSDDKIVMDSNSGSYVSVDGLYDTFDSVGNSISLTGENTEATIIGGNTVYMTGDNDSLNGNGAADIIYTASGTTENIHDDNSTIHESTYDLINLNGEKDYTYEPQSSATDGYGALSGDYFAGYDNEKPGSGAYPGNEASSYDNNSSEASYVAYDDSLSPGDANNGGDPGDTGYVYDGGYDYGAGGDPDYGDDGGDDEDYGDFVAGSSLLSSTPSATSAAIVEKYDAVTSNDPASQKAATGALVQAVEATQAASAPNPVLVPQFEGAIWQGAAATSGATASSSPTTITWSFATSAGSAADPFSGYLDAQYKGTVEQALQAWSAVSGLTFEEVPDSASTDIRIGWGDFDTKSIGLLGLTSLQQTGGAIQPGVIIRLEDPSQTALTSNASGQATYAGTDATLYQVVLHEIGHAIGLADDNDPDSVMFASSSSSNQTLDQTDIAGVQTIYGTSSTEASGTSSTPTTTESTLTPALAASSSIDMTSSGLNQLVQAMAIMTTQASATSAPLASQISTPDQQIAAAVH